jgi:hypothetical protein
MFGIVKTNNNASKQAKAPANQSTAKQMDQAQPVLQAWPNLMQDSRALREDAIGLAQLIDFASKDPNLADKNWDAVTNGIDVVKSDYKAIYGKQTYTNLLQLYSDYQSVADSVRRMWNAVDVDLGQSNKSPADRMSVRQAVNSDTTKDDILLKAAFLPEYWATSEAQYLVTQYAKAASDAKTATGTSAESCSRCSLGSWKRFQSHGARHSSFCLVERCLSSE